jgi:hypothetical protein
MLKILGRKRIILLGVLVALSVLFGGAWTQMLAPGREEVERNLSSANSALESKREDIRKLKKEYVLLQNQISQYEKVKRSGFFNDQNRVLAQETLDNFRATSGVLKANYSVLAGEEVKDDRAAGINYMVIKSPVEISIESIDDGDFYNFLKLVLEQFPGRANLEKLDVKKDGAITQEALKDIGIGKPVPLIKANIKYNWFSMSRKETVLADPNQQAGAVSGNSADPTAAPTAAVPVDPTAISPTGVPAP